MDNLQSAEDLNHFVSVMFLVRSRAGKLQALENPIEMQPFLLFPECLRLRDSSCLREASSTFLVFFLNQTGPEMTKKKKRPKLRPIHVNTSWLGVILIAHHFFSVHL